MCEDYGEAGMDACPKRRLVLVPPKPKELLMTAIGVSDLSRDCGTFCMRRMVSCTSDGGLSRLIFGGAMEWWHANTVMAASTDPAAPSM